MRQWASLPFNERSLEALSTWLLTLSINIKKTGKLNAQAARWTAISVVFAALTSIASVLPYLL
jgi:hypothetical protein